jgi:hypothetical protein
LFINSICELLLSSLRAHRALIVKMRRTARELSFGDIARAGDEEYCLGAGAAEHGSVTRTTRGTL